MVFSASASTSYISEQILEQAGSEGVVLAYEIAEKLNNPIFTGWIVELDFVFQVKRSIGQKLNLVNDEWDVVDVIEKCDMEKEDTFVNNVERLVKGCWLLPKKWNQGAYDLVSVIKSSTDRKSGTRQYCIRFVQVTQASSHSLKMKYLADIITCMGKALKCEISALEIVYMVPDNVQDFRMTDAMVLSPGLLAQYSIYDPDYKPENGPSSKWGSANIADNVKIKKFKRTVQRK